MPGPCFTAGVVTRSQLALKHQERWSAHVPDASVPLLEAFLREAAESDRLIRLIRSLPDKLALGLFSRAVAYGFPLHIALRKQAIEVQTRAEITRGIRQVVIIGAGFDTLALRLAGEFPDVRFFEIDLEEPQSIKRRALERGGFDTPENLCFMPADLSQTPLSHVLNHEERFQPSQPSLFIAEGLTMYLTEEENKNWLRGIRGVCGQQAKVIFSFIETTDGPKHIYKGLRDAFLGARQSHFRYAAREEVIRPMVENCGYKPHWVKHYAELQRMYHSQAGYERLTQQAGEHLLFASAA